MKPGQQGGRFNLDKLRDIATKTSSLRCASPNWGRRQSPFPQSYLLVLRGVVRNGNSQKKYIHTSAYQQLRDANLQVLDLVSLRLICHFYFPLARN